MFRVRYSLYRSSLGFTFVELLVALLIFSLMMSLAVPVLKVRLANGAASRYARSVKSRIEEATSMCLPHLYRGCMIAFSPDLINTSSLRTISAAANRLPYQINSGDINYVEILMDLPYANDDRKSGNSSFYSRDDISNYQSDFYRIRAIGNQDNRYYTKFFVSIIDGAFGDSRSRDNAIYVYPVIDSSDSEFSYARIYKLKLTGSKVLLCEISFSDCPSVEWEDVRLCTC
ncbi:prepilin-type N-terminal cleavage/methylation domain-containing protein [Candidatus Ichthyocystis hellenicum]|uniref:prepilin-type N-terminal cleavage/methylation domain-containing protein n=1 Tax=Candidatus Ichthyocystis hellenicum TaxID=1561003 RepID=UPI000B80B257|nr:prepilin-type N-terminal cleavage/methylation domain-containing protein [Candidatus Ichthyocystis hellenicum]